MQIEVRLSKDQYGNTQISGMVIESEGNKKEAEDAKNRLEEIYRKIVDTRASNLLSTQESSHILTTY